LERGDKLVGTRRKGRIGVRKFGLLIILGKGINSLGGSIILGSRISRRRG